MLPFFMLFSCAEDEVVVPVESIAFETDFLLIEEGESVALSVEFVPANATNKTLRWSSSDEAVARMDEYGTLSALQAGKTVITAVAEGGGDAISCTVYVVKDIPDTDEKSDRTILIYFAADNNLAPFALDDLEELKKGMLSVVSSSLHLLTYVDTGDGATLSEWVNRNGEVVEQVIKEYEDRNSTGLTETLEVFGDVFAEPAYQAESYGLVYWSHCDGWIPYPVPSTRWIGNDDGNGRSCMNLSDFKKVLEYAPHFDFIMFDACFMQSVEVAYELRQFADYYIASPTENPGPGAPYDRILPSMFIKGAAAEIGKIYFNAYNEKYNGGVGLTNDNWTAGVSVGVLKTSELDNLAVQTRQILEQAGLVEPEVLLELPVFNYDCRSNYDGHIGYYDLYGMVSALRDQGTVSEEDFAAWENAFLAARTYWATTSTNYSQFAGNFSMEGAEGVTQYIPASLTSAVMDAYRTLEWYDAAGLSSLGW